MALDLIDGAYRYLQTRAGNDRDLDMKTRDLRRALVRLWPEHRARWERETP